ncbi:Ig-like domain repeat protein [Aquisphaera insulae]|uniref:Ig-like domain repeat protein n=1 Tax=Aquisphaera insulae TaxID=2712864 RepID=UPI0013EC245E|nr:Ig-like domain repeat protein [Aquisphaera insulae]
MLRPEILALEDRRLLSNLIVTSAADTLDAQNNPVSGTLRWAIQQANAATDPSTIAFAPSVFGTPQTITLKQGQLELSNSKASISILNQAAGVTVSGGDASRVFQIDGGATATIAGLTITGGKANGTGGGINVLKDGSLTLRNCVVQSCYASDHGGGIFSDGAATVTGCTISGNTSNNWGGGIESFYDATMTVADCVISGNFSQSGGGAINNNNNLTVTDSTLSNNKSGWRLGGGIATNHGTVEMTRCTISDNFGPGDGGGVAIFDGICNLTECTITGNTTPGIGGGVDVMSGTCTITSCTISGNTSQREGGGLINQGTTVLFNTIVAGNSSGSTNGHDIDGNANLSGSYNLVGTIGNNSLVDGEDGNIVGVTDPHLSPLGNYGGPTQTRALLPGSPALGAGAVASGITTDQRGKPIRLASPDIGAYQSQGFTISAVPGSTPQATATGTAFARPLAVAVVANDPLEPAAGGVVSFSTPTNGASASLSSTTATTDASGIASVVATANSTLGFYTVTATVGTDSVAFNLHNLIATSFFGLASPTITYGTTNVTIDGWLAGTFVPQAQTVVVTLNGVQKSATVDTIGTFSTTFNASSLPTSGSPYTIQFAYAGDSNFAPAAATSTLTVTRATPSILWPSPADIVYGTVLSATQLDATSPVPGTFTYTPAAGTALKAGAWQSLLVSFIPTDGTNYNAATATTRINVLKATPTITWPSPADITYGKALGTSELDATASVPGTFAYTPAAGTILKAGAGQTLSVTFTPADTVDFATVTATTSIKVLKAPITLAWATPTDIAYGTALGAAQLDATASVPGTFAYTPAAGTILKAGAGQTLSVTFTPADAVDYQASSASVTINVQKATPAITWPNPASIVYGTALGAAQLDANSPVPGTFVYTPAAGTVLKAGAGQVLSVVFTPDDPADFNAASATTTIDVTRMSPVVTWPAPSPITYGTTLGAAQLAAIASVPGTFVYAPAAGATLKAGAGQVLTVLFTPADTADYAPVSATARIDVVKAVPGLGVSAEEGTYDGGTHAATYSLGGTHGAPAIDLEGVAPTLTYYAGPTISGTNLGASPPTHAGTYTVVASFAGSANFAAVQSAPATFTIDRAEATLTLASSSSAAVYGQPLTLVATVVAAGTPGGTVTFLEGSTPLGTVPVDSSGKATLTTAALATGSHAITASYDGGTDYLGSRSKPASAAVSPDAARIVAVPHKVLKKKKLQSILMTAQVVPQAPGSGVPTGQVIFELLVKQRKKIKVKTLGTAAVVDGQATLSFKSQKLLNKTITIVYGGEANFLATTVTLPKLTKKSLV